MAEDYSRNNFRVTPNSDRAGVQIAGSSTFGRYQKIGSGLTFNMFLSEGWLINFAGYKRVLELGKTTYGKGRALYCSKRSNFMISVVGNVVFRIDIDLSITKLRGNLASSIGEIFIDENLNGQICIVDGINAYIYMESLGPVINIQKPTGSSLASGALIPNYVCYHNTFFLFGNANSSGSGAFWYAYAFNTAVGPAPSELIIQQGTNFAISTKPDNALAVKRIPGQANNVMVFGSSVCEIWTQIGGNQNYRRNASISVDYGCISVSTIGSSDQYMAWLAANEDNSPVIMVYSGEGINRISTDGIDYLLSTIQYPEQSTANFFRQDGHLFYQLTFYNSADNMTIVYDFNTQKFFNLSDQYNNYYPACQMVYFNKNIYFNSLNNSSIYLSSTDINVYNENISNTPAEYDVSQVYVIPRVRICESIRKPDSGRFIANSFVFTLAQGDDIQFSEANLVTAEDDIVTESGSAIVTENGLNMITQDSALAAYNGLPFSNPINIIYRPRIDMAVSHDSGVTFSNYVSRNLNPLGKRKNILTWEKLGAFNDLTIKVRFVGMSNVVATDGYVDVY